MSGFSICHENFKKIIDELTQNLDSKVHDFFSPEELNYLARETKFTQRPDGKLTGSMFFDLAIFNIDKLKEQSLNDLSLDAKERFDIDITKQSLNERFNQYAPVFLKDALEKVLQQQLLEHFDFRELSHFNRVLLKDSICFDVDETLAEIYPGSGGKASKATMRIQFEYDLLNGCINDLSLNPFNDQDATDLLAIIELTAEGDLIIRDLAYINLAFLKKIIELKGFFVGRLTPNINVYELNGEEYEKLDFVEIHKKHRMSSLEKKIYIGSKEKLKVRLVVYMLPEQEVEKRLRNAQKNNKKNGGKEYKARAALNLFITNTTAEQIPMGKIWTVYRLRWQIELIFKVWKSICSIDKVKRVKQHRLECYIYAKLIFIVLGWQVLWRIARVLYYREGEFLSFYKAFKTLLNKHINRIKQALMGSKKEMGKFMGKFYDFSCSHHLLEIKETEPTPMEILLMASSI